MPEQNAPPSWAKDVVVDAQQIDVLMAKQRAEARQAVEQENTAEEPAPGAPATPGEGNKSDAPSPAKEDGDNGKPHQEPGKKVSEDLEGQKKPRRGRPPKAKTGPKADATKRKGRPPKADKDAPKPDKKQRDKVSQRDKGNAGSDVASVVHVHNTATQIVLQETGEHQTPQIIKPRSAP